MCPATWCVLAKKANPQQAVLKARVKLHQQDLEAGQEASQCNLEARIDARRGILAPGKSPNLLFEQQSPAFLLLGYGASRWAPATVGGNDNPTVRDRARAPRYQRVAGLFEDNYGLMPIESWFYQLVYKHPQMSAKVADLIGQLLPDEIEMQLLGPMFDAMANGSSPTPPLTFKMNGVSLPLDAYSDGYRNYIAWIADMVYHLWRCCPEGMELTDLHGVVLVDEIDLHLHPTWQQRVIEKCSSVLKNLQFICTSHSPLVVGSLFQANVFVLQEQDGRGPVVSRLDVNPRGLDADQLLLTPLFGMESTRVAAFHGKVDELYSKALDGDDHAALEIMRLYTNGVPDEREAG